MAKGTIKRLTDRGSGVIKTAKDRELFFHRSELEGVEFGILRKGQEVEFEIGRGNDGRLKAIKVRVAQPKGK